MKKRFLVLLTALVLAAVGLAGCDGSGTGTGSGGENPGGTQTEQPKSYTITFDTGDAPDLSSVTAEENSVVTLPTPAYEGHVFLGWFPDSACTGEALNASYTVTASVTLYAKWEIAEYTVTCVVPTGNVVQTLEYGEVLDLSAIEFNDILYECLGWSDGTQTYDADAKITVTKDMVLTGNFKMYDISYLLVEEEDPADNYYSVFRLNNNDLEEIDIPAEFKGLPVKAVEEGAFDLWNGTVKKVVVPDSVEKIGKSAFSGLYALEELDVPFVGTEKFTSIPDENGAYPNERGMFAAWFYWLDDVTDAFSAYVQYYRPMNALYYLDAAGGTQDGEFVLVGVYMPLSLTKLTIRGGIVPDFAFSNVSTLETVTLGDEVTSLGYGAFCNYSRVGAEEDGFTLSLTEIVIGENSKLSSIGELCFSEQYALESVYLPKGIKAIPDYAFKNDSALASVTFAADTALKSIGTEAFMGTALQTISLPATLQTISDRAFYQAKLTAATVPASVTEFGTAVFWECTELAHVEFAAGSPLTEIPHSTFRGDKKLAEFLLPEGISVIGEQAFAQCDLIDSFDFSGITSIGGSAFTETAFTSVKFYPCLKEIGYSAFQYCNSLTKVEFDTAESYHDLTIGYRAFFDDEELVSVNFPEGLTEIGDSAFTYTFLGSVTLPASLKTIGNSAFGMGAVTEVHFAENATLETIGEFAFRSLFGSPSLLSFFEFDKVLGTLKTIGGGAFLGCSDLTGEVTLPATIETVGEAAFSGSGLTIKTDFTRSETPSGWDAGWNEGITVSFKGDGVVHASEEYPEFMVHIEGDYIVVDEYKCPEDTYENIYLVLPDMIDGMPAKYLSTTFHGDYYYGLVYQVTLPSTMTEIPSQFFSGMGIETVIVPEGAKITKIGKEAFKDCQYLYTFDLDFSSVVSIGDNAFDGCWTWVHEITLGASLKELGKGAFAQCSEVKIHCDGFAPEEVAAQTFYWSGLVNFDFSNVSSIADEAFGHSGLSGDLVIPGNVKSIGAYAFEGCLGITSITLQDGVQSIGDSAFANSSAVQWIVIEGKPTQVGQFIFLKCGTKRSMPAVFLKDYTREESVSQWGTIIPSGWNSLWKEYNEDGDEHPVYCSGEWSYGDDGVPKAD